MIIKDNKQIAKIMDFVTFKIWSYQKASFGRVFESILKEGKINCNQWEFQDNNDFTIVEIPKYAIDRMTHEQIVLLEEFRIDF